MKARTKHALQLAGLAAICSLAFAGDDAAPQPPAPAAPSAAKPSLDREQQRAADLRVAQPLAASLPDRTTALGVVLDPTSLMSDVGERAIADAQEHAVSAEVSRLRGLYKDNVGPSLKALEAAEAEATKAHVEAQLAAARFAQHWGPLAAASSAMRQQQFDAVSSGRSLLIRADLAGQHLVGALPSRAMLEVDGVEVPGRVLGPIAYSESQSAALLIQVDHPPTGLAAGARIPLSLYGGERAGLLVPRSAILYDENGAYVYKRVTPRAGSTAPTYVTEKITLLRPYENGWLVKGVDDDDEIVVNGVAVLWSIEGGVRKDDDEDED